MENKDKPVDEPNQAEETAEPEVAAEKAPESGEESAPPDPVSTAESGGAPEVEAIEPAAGADDTAPESGKTRARGGRGLVLLALLALLLALGALGLSGWLYYSATMGGDDDEAQLQQRLSSMRSEINAATERQLEAGNALQRDLQQEMANLRQSQTAELEALREIVQQQRRRLLDLGSTDRSDWLLAEVEYLLRLANQRMVMAGDVSSALSLMMSADEIVRSLDDASLHSLRAAIASDLAALRAVPRVDTEGTWLRIQALVGQVDNLILFELPDARPEVETPAVDSGMRERLAHGFRAALARLQSYIVIRRRDEPYQAMMDPQWEGLVRQNLRMLLEQARSALLSGNQRLYAQSLDNARRWVGEFFSANESAVAALDAELEALANLAISPALPDITASLAAAKLAIDERHNLVSGGQQ